MSKPKVFEKPGGVKDYLPEAVSRLRAIEGRVLDCMRTWGYRQIMTPTLEFYDTVGAASSTANERLFKLLDKRGTTLVLRSEMTAPIARVVASLLNDEKLPLRLSHHSTVFRAIEEEAGKESEFFQTGVELVGDGSAEADAEVAALAVACLRAAGVRDFKLALGHIGFLDGLLEYALPGRAEEQSRLKSCLLKRDYVGYRYELSGMALDGEAQARLERLLRLRGGREVFEAALQAAKATEPERAGAPTAAADSAAGGEAGAGAGAGAGHAAAQAARAIGHLRDVWDALDVYGVSEHVMIDLTMTGNYSYYTGLIFEGYAADLGFPVCSGGRYDKLLEQFGRPAPATGFALETNRIMQVARDDERQLPRILIMYSRSRRSEAIAQALKLREQGDGAVETYCIETGLPEPDLSAYDEVVHYK